MSVIKIGGSVLTDRTAYRRAAAFVAVGSPSIPASACWRSCRRSTARPMRSSAWRETSARGPTRRRWICCGPPANCSRWRSWCCACTSWASRPQPSTCTRPASIEPDALGEPTSVRLRALRLRALIAAHDVVVAPGFLARGAADSIVSLGRGGSDLTAVLLAAGLQARLLRAGEGRARVFLWPIPTPTPAPGICRRSIRARAGHGR